MKFIELVKTRQSNRKYSDNPVEREKIDLCLEAARLSPSASNSQPWYFIVVDEPGLKEKVAKETFGRIISFNHFTMQAPVLIVVITENPKIITQVGQTIKKKKYNHYDVGIACEHFCLQAAELKLGTCMLGWFNEKAVKKILKLPNNKHIDLILTLGYPSENKIRNKNRKKLNEIRSYNSYK